MDTSDPQITFDDQGVCNHCHNYIEKAERVLKVGQDRELTAIVEKIKKSGKNKEYDCVLGVSGGIDSSYAAYIAHQLGLRVLLVHFDNGWNSEVSVRNIENISKKLGFDLYTYVVDWEEFKDLQLAYLKSSVIDIEVPTDHGIRAAILNTAIEKKIKYILGGNNIVTEGIIVPAWVWRKDDLHNLKAIHKKFGNKIMQTFPKAGYGKIIFYENIRGIKRFFPLNYVKYQKQEAKMILINELEWEDYGKKHYESRWTQFFQSYILPTKFGIDKRKMHLSTLINSDQITREEALEELKQPLYDPRELERDKEYVLKKFGLSIDEFDVIMNLPIKRHQDYGTDNLIHILIGLFQIIKNPLTFKDKLSKYKRQR